MRFILRKRTFFAFAAVAALPGCELVEMFLDGLATLKAQPQFGYLKSEAVVGGSAGEITTEVTTGAVTRPGEAFLFAPVRPIPDRYNDPRALVWTADGERLAVSVHEEFFQGFDDWIFVYDRNLHQQFFGSDDTMGTAMSQGCAPIDAARAQPAADELIDEGAIPAGSIARFRPGTGEIQGATLLGWLSDDAFVMTLFHEPLTFAVAPDGSEHDLSPLTGTPTLGEFVTVAATFTEAGGAWTAGDCSLTIPAMPARVPSGAAVTLGPGGAVLADGVALADQNGNAITGAAAADGSY
ncbi:MAG: hypothetical protein KDE03_17470 [Rhodobacteraceae bacterium]|nr:hypothetical protein [Paracoccaceae bacterium]